ncbi:uncharacterized protein LOC142488405 isoform X3 [Ascaphus truei]|uniref:uncharacterized protein LOC142488405 isoform X3 n=1 Tax=Ascaphus truei TaxID=8439 RepID=UPI003F598085
MDPHLLSFPVVVPERLEIKSEKEETDTEEHRTPIKEEIDAFPVCGFPVVVLESLEIKSEKEETDTEEHLTPIKREIDSFPVCGEASHQQSSSVVQTKRTRKKRIEKKRNIRFNDEENKVLVTEILQRYDRLFGNLVAKTPFRVKKELWKEVQVSVSACGNQLRNYMNCRKRFVDIKRNVKSKLHQIRLNATATGGRPPDPNLSLTEMEEQVSQILNPILVEGLPGDLDIGVYAHPFPPGARASALSSPASALSSPASRLQSPLPNQEITSPVLAASQSYSLRSTSQSPRLTRRQHARVHQDNLASQQQSEVPFLESQTSRHQQLMGVQQQIVAELVSIKHILNRNSTAFDILNCSLQSIAASLIKQNELRACAPMSRRQDSASSPSYSEFGIFSTPHFPPPLSSSPATPLPSFQTPLLPDSPATFMASDPAPLLPHSAATKKRALGTRKRTVLRKYWCPVLCTWKKRSQGHTMKGSVNVSAAAPTKPYTHMSVTSPLAHQSSTMPLPTAPPS